MNAIRPLLFLGLLGLSGVTAYLYVSSRAPKTKSLTQGPEPSKRADAPPSGSRRVLKPLLLDEPQIPRIDPTHYEVTVSDLSLQTVGKKIENEARTRLQEFTARYRLSANQRREAFPLIVSHHPDFTPGLVVNGSSAGTPGASDFATNFSEILNLSQRELFQEDLGADHAWWREVLLQIRDDLEGRPGSAADPDEASDPPAPDDFREE